MCPTSRCGAYVEPVTRGIGEVLDLSARGESFGLGYFKGNQRTRRTPYAQAAREQVAAGLEKFGGKPFIVTRRNNVKVKSLHQPIGTLTAQGGGHHYLACPTADMSVDGCAYRPLTIREKARCQGFPDGHVFAGTESDQRLQVGNAVPVNVAAWLARRVKAVLPH
ncbi:DNA cytosine methyltransferase [Streptomyces adustus]|uniref:DNA cytosine methyltransferase n=1 Tax=Streptomyces adustus TaxID=1609272 RepID=UPI00371FFDE1